MLGTEAGGEKRKTSEKARLLWFPLRSLPRASNRCGRYRVDGQGGNRRSAVSDGTAWEAQLLAERWQREYNTVRAQSVLNYRVPPPKAIQSQQGDKAQPRPETVEPT